MEFRTYIVPTLNMY